MAGRKRSASEAAVTSASAAKRQRTETKTGEPTRQPSSALPLARRPSSMTQPGGFKLVPTGDCRTADFTGASEGTCSTSKRTERRGRRRGRGGARNKHKHRAPRTTFAGNKIRMPPMRNLSEQSRGGSKRHKQRLPPPPSITTTTSRRATRNGADRARGCRRQRSTRGHIWMEWNKRSELAPSCNELAPSCSELAPSGNEVTARLSVGVGCDARTCPLA